MKNLFTTCAAAIACVFVAPLANAEAYKNVEIHNGAYYPAVVTVRYIACQPDTFTVPGRSRTQWPYWPSKTTAPGTRGACLIQSISATLKDGKYPINFPIKSFNPPVASSEYEFLIRYTTGKNYQIDSRTALYPNWTAVWENTNSPQGRPDPARQADIESAKRRLR